MTLSLLLVFGCRGRSVALFLDSPGSQPTGGDVFFLVVEARSDATRESLRITTLGGNHIISDGVAVEQTCLSLDGDALELPFTVRLAGDEALVRAEVIADDSQCADAMPLAADQLSLRRAASSGATSSSGNSSASGGGGVGLGGAGGMAGTGGTDGGGGTAEGGMSGGDGGAGGGA